MTDSLRHPRSIGRTGLLLLILLLTAALRYVGLVDVPPGIEHDEVAEVLIADRILDGHHALFFEEAYGQEPLFLYLVAGSLTLLGRNVLALRFVSASIGVLTVAAGIRLTRRLFGPRPAVIAAVGLGWMLWPVFWSRVGLRGMLLPLTLSLGLDALWAAYAGSESGYRRTLGAGLWLGLTAYTYSASRGIPLLLGGWIGALLLVDRRRLLRRWRRLVLVCLTGILIALPLIITVSRNHSIQTRVYEVNAPLNALRQGDFRPVLANVPRVLGMFAVRGDDTVRNNMPDRPVFPEPIWAGLFYLGLVVALVRLRDARYALVLVWLGAMMIPSLVTIEAPNFVRTLGAMPAVMILPAVGADWLFDRLGARGSGFVAAGRVVIGAAAFVNLGWTGWDYFVRWPAVPETQFVWQTDLRNLADWLDAKPELRDVTVGGLSATSMDEPSLQLMLVRQDLRSRWCDPGSPLGVGGGVLVPGDGGWLAVPSVTPLDPNLADMIAARWGTGERLTAQSFTAYPLEMRGDSPEGLGLEFTGGVWLLEVQRSALEQFAAGAPVTLTSGWRAGKETPSALKTFVHLADVDGVIRAQHDGLDCPSRFWRAGDLILQRHVLRLPDDLPPGRYTVRIGLYDQETLDPYPLLEGSTYYELETVDID